MLAFGTYVAGTYGGVRSPRIAGGLNAWQRRAATEMIAAHLDGGITVEELAAVCGLSASRFAHAFRNSSMSRRISGCRPAGSTAPRRCSPGRPDRRRMSPSPAASPTRAISAVCSAAPSG